MNQENNYVVEIINDDLYRYYKNGKLHREAGPAKFSSTNKQYINLGDEHLYKIKRVSDNNQINDISKIFDQCLKISPIKGSSSHTTMSLVLENFNNLLTAYYLDGVEYEKNEFDILKLQRDLSKELLETNKQNKPKIKL
jgi:hypothetical protein